MASRPNWSDSAQFFQTAREGTNIIPLQYISSDEGIQFYALSDKSFQDLTSQ